MQISKQCQTDNTLIMQKERKWPPYSTN